MGRNSVTREAFWGTGQAEGLPAALEAGQAELLDFLAKAGLFIALEPDGFTLLVHGPPEVRRRHREAIMANKAALVDYLQGKQRQREIGDLAALEGFCDTDCQYLKTFRADGELQRWCHAGRAAGKPWLTARLFSLRECPRREAPVPPPESAKERGEQEHREGFQQAWQWIKPRLERLLATGWTRQGLFARSRLVYPYLWGIAWSGPWQRQGLNVALEQDGTIAFAFPTATGRAIVQRARAR